jgi:hypothetical protein
MTWRSEYHFRAIRDACRGMRGEIVAAGIGFRLDYDSGSVAVYEDLTQ